MPPLPSYGGGGAVIRRRRGGATRRSSPIYDHDLKLADDSTGAFPLPALPRMTGEEKNMTLILHHYDFSNFAEKARLMLGFKGLAWRSVEQPPILPRPQLIPA